MKWSWRWRLRLFAQWRARMRDARTLRRRELTGIPIPARYTQDMIELEKYSTVFKALLAAPLIWFGVNIVLIVLFHLWFRQYPWFEANIEWVFHHPWSAT